MLDKDHNGYIDRDELLQILNKHGYLNNEKVNEELEEIFASTDVNHDGKIDFNEFALVMKKVVD